MLALGLDPSLRAFGFAVVDTSTIGLARRIVSNHYGTTNKEVPPHRYSFFQEKIREYLRLYPQIEVIGIESPAFSAGPFQTIHFALLQFSLVVAFEARKDVVLFDPATREYLVREDPKLKRGKIHKLDVQRYVQRDTMDHKIINDNQADAYVIGKFAARFMELLNGKISPEDLTPSEYQKFIGMTRKKKTLSGVKEIKTAHVFRENHRFYQFSKVSIGDSKLPKKSKIDLKTKGMK